MHLRIDARLWIEHLSEVSQFVYCHSLTTHWNLFRSDLLSLSQLTPPFLLSQNFHQLSSNCGRISPCHLQHSNQTTLAWQREASMVWTANWTCTPTPFYFLTSSGDHHPLLVVIIIVYIWILKIGKCIFSIIIENLFCMK